MKFKNSFLPLLVIALTFSLTACKSPNSGNNTDTTSVSKENSVSNDNASISTEVGKGNINTSSSKGIGNNKSSTQKGNAEDSKPVTANETNLDEFDVKNLKSQDILIKVASEFAEWNDLPATAKMSDSERVAYLNSEFSSRNPLVKVDNAGLKNTVVVYFKKDKSTVCTVISFNKDKAKTKTVVLSKDAVEYCDNTAKIFKNPPKLP